MGLAAWMIACGGSDGPGSGGEETTTGEGEVLEPRTATPSRPGVTLDELEIEASFRPQWNSTAQLPEIDASDADGGSTVSIYLDLSTPMGGFLPVDASRESGANQYRAVVQWVSDHLTGSYPSAVQAWKAVGDDVRDLPGLPLLTRNDFGHSRSRIDLVVREAIADVWSGRSPAAAIVSDLLVTGSDGTVGANELIPILEPWIHSPAGHDGRLHVGLLGVYARYWGAASSTCRIIDGLGCWYSERGREWRRMDAMTPRPFYVLLIGSGAAELDRIMASIDRDVTDGTGAQSDPIQTQHERLTRGSAVRARQGRCVVFEDHDYQEPRARARSFSLRLNGDGTYTALRDDAATLACTIDGFRRSEPPVLVRGGEDGEDAESGFVVPAMWPDEAEIAVSVYPEFLRDPPALELTVMVQGRLDFGPQDQHPSWIGWSNSGDDVSEFPATTIRLRELVDGLRLIPDFYEATVEVLRGRSP